MLGGIPLSVLLLPLALALWLGAFRRYRRLRGDPAPTGARLEALRAERMALTGGVGLVLSGGALGLAFVLDAALVTKGALAVGGALSLGLVLVGGFRSGAARTRAALHDEGRAAGEADRPE